MREFLAEYVWSLGTPVQWAVLLAMIVVAVLLWRGNRKIGRFLTTAQTILDLAKIWYEHGQAQHSDANWSRQQTVEVTQEATRTAIAAAGKVAAVAAKSAAVAAKSADEIKAAIAAAPKATAVEVVGLLEAKAAGDSGTGLPIPSPAQ